MEDTDMSFVLGFRLECATHRAVQRTNTIIGKYMAMQYCNIAESTYPFRLFYESSEVKAVNNAAHAIAATPHYYRVQFRIIQHVLQVGAAFFICAGKVELAIAYGLPFFHVKSPAVQYFYCVCNALPCHITRRTSNTNYR